MTPRKKGLVPDDVAARLVAAVEGKASAEQELRDAVTEALLAGGSVREVARISGLSTNTVERWGRAGGWPSAEQQAQWAAERQRNADFRARIRAAEQHQRYIEGADDE
ncbi:hypothetical protein ACTHQY_19285 [Rhodococcoides corynebacterioides]|uniref:hypothetical protein n=1 Tax=Rhodococcoides corynebacterioides TaxID=53972 RepID=UPI003F811760